LAIVSAVIDREGRALLARADEVIEQGLLPLLPEAEAEQVDAMTAYGTKRTSR
jgi:hypothetical protein